MVIVIVIVCCPPLFPAVYGEPRLSRTPTKPGIPMLRSLILALAIAAPAAAQIPATEYAARRAEVARRVGDGAVLAFGAPAPVDYVGAYRQTPSFLYLTGWERPNGVFLMEVRGGAVRRALLFEPASDPRMVLYDGFPLDSADVRERTGMVLLPIERLEPELHALFDELPVLTISDIQSRDYAETDSLTRGRAFVRHVSEHHPEVTFRSIDPLLDSLRVVKSDAEVALLRDAISITVEALETAMRVIEPGMNEGGLEAVIEYSFRTGGADGAGFGSIVGSGPNSTSFHYRANDRDMEANDVVVMDVGAIVDGYTADVTRTVPVDGTFSDEQRAIYEIVLAAQQAAVGEIRAGAATSTGNDAMRSVIARGLARLGLTQGVDARLDPPWADSARCVRQPLVCSQAYLYMAHGPGHGIGLEVHDVGGHSYSFSGRFAENEVLTVEPGIYVSETLLDMLPDTPRNAEFIRAVRGVVRRYANIGMRVEDDYLVTRTGVEWLSPAPREIADIESMMALPASLPMP